MVRKFFPVVFVLLSLSGMSLDKKWEINRFLQSELEVNIHPMTINENISYSDLIKMDQNADGFINQLDDNHKLKLDSWKDILDSYLVYLNQYQQYDAHYRCYQDMDLNLNNKVEHFEEILFNKRKEGNENGCGVILGQAQDDRNLTEYQFDRANYALINYFGHYQKRFQKRRQLAKKYPHSPFKIIEAANFRKLNKHWFDYRFDKNEPQWLFSEYLAISILPRIHLYRDYMKLISYETDELFPYAFSDDVFMQKFISALLWNVDGSIGKKSKKLRETKDKKTKENLNHEIKRMKDRFDQLDLIYNHLSKKDRTSNFISDQVTTQQIRLRTFERERNINKVSNFDQALKLVQDYIADNPDIQKNDYHLVVSALLKNHIENKKSYDDGNVLFSPDMLFAKGNGVCADQSSALALLLMELTGNELNARLYFWKRKYYYAHMSMIYRNFDGFYYIMDNQGIQAFRYASVYEAVRSNSSYACEYRESISMDSSPGENKLWTNVLYGNKNTITSPDDKLTIKFNKSRKID